MKVFGPIDFNNNEMKQAGLELVTSFPAAKKGRMVFRADLSETYICVSASPDIWLPLTNTLAYVHHQPGGGTIWYVNHGLGTTDLFVQVWDDTNLAIIPDEIQYIDANNITILFGSSSVKGKAVVSGLTDHVGITLEPVSIDDSVTSDVKCWSSEKTQTEILNIPRVWQDVFDTSTEPSFDLDTRTVYAVYGSNGLDYELLTPGVDYSVTKAKQVGAYRPLESSNHSFTILGSYLEVMVEHTR